MKKACLLAVATELASANHLEFISSDLYGPKRAIDNIKAEWSQALNVLGKSARLTGKYDRNERENFLNEATLSGEASFVNYEISHDFNGHTGLTLKAKADDGTAFEAEADVEGIGGKVTKVTATRDTNLRGQDCSLEISHEPQTTTSKVRLSTVLGSGLKAIGSLTSKGGDHNVAYEVEYDTTLNDGRTLSAHFTPADGSGEIEYEDKTTLDATLRASIPLGGAPKVTVSRSFGW